MSKMSIQSCPICSIQMNVMERYPNRICNSHYGECRDMEGNIVTFENEGPQGGFVSCHIVNGKIEKRRDGYCLVRGQRCHAEEMRFGGIVIQIAE